MDVDERGISVDDQRQRDIVEHGDDEQHGGLDSG